MKDSDSLPSSTPSREGRAILLWAITHPTLVKAEVPILREAGLRSSSKSRRTSFGELSSSKIILTWCPLPRTRQTRESLRLAILDRDYG